MKWDDLTEDQKDVVIETTANAVGDALDCMRVWSAWSYGTMGEDDFLPVRDSNERLVDIARAVVEALPSPTAEMVSWEPRDGCPTVEQVNAWNDVPDTAWLVGLDLVHLYPDAGVIEVWQYHQRSLSHEWPWHAVVPVRDGRPVSWSEVDAAIAAMEVEDV